MNNILGRNIRKARLKRGWTQKQLAEAKRTKNNWNYCDIIVTFILNFILDIKGLGEPQNPSSP